MAYKILLMFQHVASTLTSIDLILTNCPSYFQHSTVFETGLSDFHLLTITEFKKRVSKNESLKLSNTVTTKTLTTTSLDLKY